MRIVQLQKKHVLEAAKILDETYFDTLKEAQKHILDKTRKKHWFVAIISNKIVGVLGYCYDYNHYANYIVDIAVSKLYRKQGVATKLLQRFIERSRKEQPSKQPYCLSSTDVTNKESIRLHLKFGFKKLGEIKELHYGKDEIFFGYKL